jgi:hypothetical protein
MGPLGILGLLDRTGVKDRAVLGLPSGWRDSVSAISNPQAFVMGQLKNAATDAIAKSSPEAAAGIAALNIPKAFEDDLKQSVINGTVANSPMLQQFVPVKDYKTVDLIRTIQNGVNPQIPTYDNIDVGGGFNPAAYSPNPSEFDLAFAPMDMSQFSTQMPELGNFGNFEAPVYDYGNFEAPSFDFGGYEAPVYDFGDFDFRRGGVV